MGILLFQHPHLMTILFNVNSRVRIHASMRGHLLFRAWAPTFRGSPSRASSPHCPCGPLKWQVAELVVEGAHLQMHIVQSGHLLPAMTVSWVSALWGCPAAIDWVRGRRRSQAPSRDLTLLPCPLPPCPHSGFILSVSSRFLARTASSWASRRVELRASARTCLAKACRSSSWGEECRRRWAYWTGLGVEGELGRGGQGAGSHGARIPPKVTHQALSLGITLGNLAIHWSPQLHLARRL